MNTEQVAAGAVRKENEGGAKKWFTANEVLKMKIEGSIWLWDNYIPKGEITGITGPSDTGKSTLLRQLALAIVAGAPEFLGISLNTEGGDVIYISTEDGAIRMQQSLQKQVIGMGLNEECLQKLHFLFNEENVFVEIEEKLRSHPVELLIIDAMSDTFDGNANDFVVVRAYMKKLKLLIHRYKCSVILLHHNTKNSEKGAPDKNKLNGSQALEAKMRSLFELRLGDSNHERILTIVKGNSIPQELKNQKAVIKFNGEYLLFSNTGSISSTTPHGGGGRRRFDVDLWKPRMAEIMKEGLSYDKARRRLAGEFGNEEVPKLTWFKNNKQVEEVNEAVAPETSAADESEIVNDKL